MSHLARTQRFRKRGPIVCWRKILEELDPVATETQAAAVHRLGRCAAAAGFLFIQCLNALKALVSSGCSRPVLEAGTKRS